MKKLRAIIYVFRNSLISVDYYKDLINVNTRFSLKYFVILATIAVLITTIKTSIFLIPKFEQFSNNLLTELAELYPNELVISAKDNKWEINQAEPYIIKTPKLLKMDNDYIPSNFLVFNRNGVLDDLKTLDTLILVNEVNIIVKNSEDNYEVYPIGDIPNGEINKNKYSSAIASVQKYINYMELPVILGALFVSSLYFFCYRFFYLFLFTLVTRLVGYLKGLRYPISDYFKISIHTMTLPLALEVMFVALGARVDFPLWFFALHLFYTIAVIYGIANTKSTQNTKIEN